jgi:pyruvate/2-oxoglutarate dehydrogenase complex dihydrolipoamide dehydrogenase (E3) component
MRDYDVLILGGGSAGTSAARAAVEAGARTAMINDGELGGLCILRGCMPTKTMLASAHIMHTATGTEPFGVVNRGTVSADFPAIMDRKDRMVARFKKAKTDSIEGQRYDVIDARARFHPDGGLLVGRTRMSARQYVLAVGSVPSSVPLPGMEQVEILNSDDVMKMREQPDSLVVQGGGPIAIEMALFFARIGTRTVLVNRSSCLKLHDPEIGDEMKMALCHEPNLQVAAPGRIRGIEKDGDAGVFTIESEEATFTFRSSRLLMAVGREAALEGLDLPHVGIRAENGRVIHDSAMQTTNPDVYVAGDASGDHQVLHIANQEGAVAGANAALGRPKHRMDYRLKMSVIFSDPPLAAVGKTGPELMAAGIRFVSGTARFPETGRAITMGVEHGIWRLYADATTGEILGAVILGPNGDDLIHIISTMMHYHGTARDIMDRMPWYHPTQSEVIMNLAREIIPRLDPVS